MAEAKITRAELVERIALRNWQRREMRFPAFARRMNPDDLDRATGAWALCLAKAAADLTKEDA